MGKNEHLKKLVGFLAILTGVYGCLDPYNPPTSRTDVNYLVVEAFLNSNGPTQVKLSRTLLVGSTNPSPQEINATVIIEGEDGSTATLIGNNEGLYTLPAIPVDANRKYRLKIRTADQEVYESDFVSVKQAPPVDSVRYEVTGEDLQLYLSTHDQLNATKFYLWKYVETWQYNSAFQSYYYFQDTSMLLRPDPNIFYYCWTTELSNEILISSSSRLGQDVIHDFPFRKLNLYDKKFQTRYSILVQQYALSEDAYNYYDQLKKSTETNGSIFDPQPSQSPSNIHGITHPEVPVIGYFGAGSVQTKRIFISRQDIPHVPRLTGYEDCQPDTLLLADVAGFDGQKLVITVILYPHSAQIMGYQIASPFCVDCRLTGGANVRPSFW